MTTTTNLGVTHIVAAQDQKEVTANAAFERLDAAITELLSVSLASGNASPTAAQVQQAAVIYATGVATSGRTVTLPAVQRPLILECDSGNTHSVGFIRGSTTVTVTAGSRSFVYVDGTTNGLKVIAGAGGTGSGSGDLLAANNLSDVASASSARTNLGLAIGTNVQAYDAELAAIAGLTSAADALPYFTGSGTAATTTLTSTARSLLDDTSTGAMRTTLGLVIGTDVLAYSGNAAALAGVTSAADALPYFTGSGTATTTTLTSTARSLLDDTSVGAMRTTLGVVEHLGWALGDETTAITTGTAVVTDYLPCDCTINSVFIGVSAQSTSGSVTVDVKKNGTTLFSTKPSIDANEDTSLTGTAAVLNNTSGTKGDKITFNIDAAGTGAKGLKVWMEIAY